MNYQFCNLGDLADIGRGSSPRPITDTRYFQGGNIPWIKIADATSSGKFIYETKEHVNDFGASFSRKLQKGSLIIAASGTLGFPKFLGVEGCIHDGWMYFENFKLDKINPDYLYYALITLRSYFNNLSYGAAIQNINTPILKKTRIALPSLKVQNRIASILSAYDDLIEKNNRKIAILQEMAEEIYKEWFVRFRFPGHKTTKFHKGIPEDWEYGTIKDLGSFVRGKNITADEMEEGDIPVISAGIEPSGFHSESNVQGVSITISSSGANAGFLRINYSDIWAADCSFINDMENIFYMYELLNNMRPCIDNLQRGAAQPHVYPKDINKLKIVLPPLQLRTKFNEIAKQAHLTIATLQKQNKNLTQQRDLLLHRLMSGKLEVKV